MLDCEKLCKFKIINILNDEKYHYKQNNNIEFYIGKNNNIFNYKTYCHMNQKYILVLPIKDYKMYTQIIKIKNLDEEKQMILMYKIIEKLNINIDDL